MRIQPELVALLRLGTLHGWPHKGDRLIVDAVPRTRIIIAEVWRPLLALFIWDVIVTVAYYVLPFKARCR